MKQKNIKNYISLILIILITILIVFALRNWYRNYKEYHESTSEVKGLLTEISLEELNPYLKENGDSFIYICTPKNKDCRNFEKSFKNIVIKNSLNNNMIYLNAKEDNFIEEFNALYKGKIKLKYYPAIVRIYDNKIMDITSKTSKGNLSKDDVLKYLELNEIGE